MVILGLEQPVARAPLTAEGEVAQGLVVQQEQELLVVLVLLFYAIQPTTTLTLAPVSQQIQV
jgi:hypothetical protein